MKKPDGIEHDAVSFGMEDPEPKIDQFLDSDTDVDATPAATLPGAPTDLLIYQLAEATAPGMNSQFKRELVKQTIDLYHKLKPADGFDSISARVIVGLCNMNMELLAREWSLDLRKEEVRFKYAIKAAIALTEMMRQYHLRQERLKKSPKGSRAKRS